MIQPLIKTEILANFSFCFVAVVVLTILLYLTSKIKWFAVIPLSLFVIWAFLKRVLYLGDSCFWWDEFLTETRVWFSGAQLFKHPITARSLLYSFILKLYALIVSFFNHHNYLTEFQLRLPHAIIGTLALFIIYLIGKKIKDKVTGLLMVFLATFSSFLIYYAREARFYPFVLFFSACTIHSVVLIIYREKNCSSSKTLIYYVYYTLSAFCGMHTHQGFWLLFAASNIFLVIYELINLAFDPYKKRKDILFLIAIFILLVLPLATVYSGISALLGKGVSSNIIKGDKLVPHLSIVFFKSVHNELWSGIICSNYMHFIVFAASIAMLFFKKTRTFSLYLLTVMVLTFIALRNMGTFKEPFRVKYITFMWLAEMICIVSAVVALLDFLLAKIKNYNIATGVNCFVLSLISVISLSNAIETVKLPSRTVNKESFRTIAKILSENILPEDVVITTGPGYEALQYYKRVYSSDWKIVRIEQIESRHSGNYVYDGFAYCLIPKKTIQIANPSFFTNLNSKNANYILYKSQKPLDKSLQNNLIFELIDGFKDFNNLSIDKHKERIYFTDNYIVNGNFTNNFSGWKTSFVSKNDMTIKVLSNNNDNYLIVTNNYFKPLIFSQTVYIPTGGLYSLTFKTRGFFNGGHLAISSKDVNAYIYKDELLNCLFPRFRNFLFKKPQKVTLSITIKPKGYAAIYDFGFYKLDKRSSETKIDKAKIKNDDYIVNENVDDQKEYLHLNLLTNGDFKDGLDGWLSTKGISVIFNDNDKRCVELVGQTNRQIRIWQNFNAVSGHIYRLTFKAKAEQTSAFAIFRDNVKKGEKYLFLNQGKVWKEYSKDFKANNSGVFSLFLSCQGKGNFYYSDASLFDITEKK